jgi:hypothetical protein
MTQKGSTHQQASQRHLCLIDLPVPLLLPKEPSIATNAPDNASSDSAMQGALESYKKQMYNSNEKLISDHIEDISAMDLSAKEKLDVMDGPILVLKASIQLACL